jgi:SAM-dependent methyltransferase
MSLYEKYNVTFKDYNTTRISVGIDIITNNIKKNNYKKIVDIGCGSGSYLSDLYNYAQKTDENITLLGIDGSKEMLSNIPSIINTKHLVFSPITLLDIGKVDMIIINQVIHHLDKPTLLNLFNECFNSLNTNGMLYINTCTYEQVLNGQWWALYFPKSGIDKFGYKADIANNILLNKYTPFEIIQLEEPLQNNYYDYNKVFTTVFRNCDSMWSLLTDEELSFTLAGLKIDLECNDMTKINKSNEYRKKYGQTTTYLFKKS